MQPARALPIPAVVGFACLLGLLASRSAFACGQSEPQNYFSFGAPAPGDGSTGLPRDTPIVLAVNGYSPDGSLIVPQFRLHIADAALTDSDGNVAQLRSPEGDLWGNRALSRVFAPTTPLSPNTRYHFGARITDLRVQRPTDATGTEQVDFYFSTGAALAPALTLTGELDFSLTTEEVPTFVCGPCGESCVESGTRSARMAHLLLPAPSGGNGLVGYQGVVYLTDEQPLDVGTERPFTGAVLDHELSLQTWVQLESDSRQLLDIELPVRAEAYRACFTLQVWDPGEGHVAALAKCLDMPIAPETDPDSVSNDQPAASRPAQASSNACSVVARVGRGGRRTWPSLALAALLGFALSVRRARR